MKNTDNIGISEYQKNLATQEVVKKFYNKTEIGSSIFVVHKKTQGHQEYKFFCTSYQGKDYILVSPKHWNVDFATHSDLMNIAFSFIGVDKNNIKKKLEFYNTEFIQNAFHGTIGKNPKENTMNFCCLDACPNVSVSPKLEEKNSSKKAKRTPEELKKEILKKFEKVHKRLFNSLNQVIKSNKVKPKSFTPPKSLKNKSKQRPKPKPRRR